MSSAGYIQGHTRVRACALGSGSAHERFDEHGGRVASAGIVEAAIHEQAEQLAMGLGDR
jgi:hypothetical protein